MDAITEGVACLFPKKLVASMSKKKRYKFNFLTQLGLTVTHSIPNTEVTVQQVRKNPLNLRHRWRITIIHQYVLAVAQYRVQEYLYFQESTPNEVQYHLNVLF